MKKPALFPIFCSLFIFLCSLILIGCGDGGNNKNGDGKTRFIFSNKAPPTSLSVERSSRSIMIGGTTVDVGSFSELNNYYDRLNGLVRSYTPTEFFLGVYKFSAYGLNYGSYKDNNNTNINWGNEVALFDETTFIIDDSLLTGLGITIPLVDFADMSTFTITHGLPAGSTTKAFSFHFVYDLSRWFQLQKVQSGSLPRITFTLDDRVPSNHPLKTNTPDPDFTPKPSGTQASSYAATAEDYRLIACAGNKVSVEAFYLLPYLDHHYYQPDIGFYSGKEYKYFTDGALSASEATEYRKLIQSLGVGLNNDAHADNRTLGHLFTPMNTVRIPSDATGIDITVNWYLEGIIEQYRGADNSPDTEDDVFVLARDFWQRLSLSVSTK